MSQDAKAFGRADADTLVRLWNLFYNRTVAYSYDHPVAQETVPKVFEAFLKCMGGADGSLSLLFQEVGYFIGHVDMAYAPNNRRIADHLRRFGIESISISGPLSAPAFARFLDACSLTHANPAGFTAYLANQGVRNFTVNDVSLQTVKEGEAVVSQAGQRPGGPAGENGARTGSGGAARPAGAPKSAFDDVAMKVVLGHLTAQEVSANLGILKMLESPSALPDALLRTAAGQGGNEAAALKHSLLNVAGAFRAEAGQGTASVEDLLAGMYSMRAELLKAVKAQQGLAQHLSAPQEVEKAADDVFVATAAQLVMGEYQRCKGNPKRMAQVVQRIVPDKAHLQKVLAVFRAELLKQGAPLIEFYNLMAELNTLMGADQSYKEFLQAGHELGVSPDELLRELQADPRQAAHLIVLASEARRMRAGSAEDLVQNLTDYVEKTGDAIGERIARNPREAGRLSSLLGQVEAEVNSQLLQRAMPDEVRQMGQQKLRHRMQRSLADLKGRAVAAQLGDASASEAEKVQFLLEMFPDEKEMDGVMSLVRETLDQDSVAKEVADQVMHKVRQELAARREKLMSKELPSGVYVKAVLDFFIKSEISRATRYDVPFTALLLSFQGLPEDKAAVERHGDALRGLQNVLIGDLRRFLRESDFVGYLTFNRFLVVLPMTTRDAIPSIVKKFSENLSRQVALPDGSRLSVKPRIGMAAFDKTNLNTYQKIYAELLKSWQGQGG